MSFEVDFSDIPSDSFYGDDRCKKLERILQQDSDFAEYRVKRYRTEVDPTQDPYYIISQKKEEEEYIMWLNEWEIDALDESEMLSYITVNFKTSKRPNPAENWMLIATLFAALFSSSILIYFVIPEFQTYSFYPMLIIASFFLMVVLGAITYSRYKSYSRRTKELDIELIQQHPLFLQAIRKFACLENISDSKRAEYERRLEEIETIVRDGYAI